MLQKKDSGTGTSDVHDSQEKGQNDERSFTRLRGWLNWLSLGMLGAGGTADSSSFTGVVSDEIIKVLSMADQLNLLLHCVYLWIVFLFRISMRLQIPTHCLFTVVVKALKETVYFHH